MSSIAAPANGSEECAQRGSALLIRGGARKKRSRQTNGTYKQDGRRCDLVSQRYSMDTPDVNRAMDASGANGRAAQHLGMQLKNPAE